MSLKRQSNTIQEELLIEIAEKIVQLMVNAQKVLRSVKILPFPIQIQSGQKNNARRKLIVDGRKDPLVALCIMLKGVVILMLKQKQQK